MSGEKRGPLAATARGLLSALSKGYGLAVQVRNRGFDRGRRSVVHLDHPVISVGNITTGGTGKTPMCIWLADQLVNMQRRPAVVSRGYGAKKDTIADEMQVVSRHVPRAVCVANPHRVAAAEFAVEEYEADVIVMDDGFQHRGLGRDLDMVLIDASRPFGFEHLLPRGLLREPVENLSRADMFLITRADTVSPTELLAVFQRLKSLNPEAITARCRHRQTGFISVDGYFSAEPANSPHKVFLTAGIGHPQTLAAAVVAQGYKITGACWWPDHHSFRRKDARYVIRRAEQLGAQAVFTTEKDLVKLQHLGVDWGVPVFAVTVEIEFMEDDATMVLDRLRRMLADFDRNRQQMT